MKQSIQAFGVSSNKDLEYFKKYLIEGLTVGQVMLDTLEDLEFADDLYVQDLIEEVNEQFTFLGNLTDKIFLQQLSSELQDTILDARTCFTQVQKRYEYLSSGRMIINKDFRYSTIDPTEADISWDTAKQIAEIGLKKFIMLMNLMVVEAKIKEVVLENEEELNKIKTFVESTNGIKDDTNISELFGMIMEENSDEKESDLEPEEINLASFDIFE